MLPAGGNQTTYQANNQNATFCKLRPPFFTPCFLFLSYHDIEGGRVGGSITEVICTQQVKIVKFNF